MEDSDREKQLWTLIQGYYTACNEIQRKNLTVPKHKFVEILDKFYACDEIYRELGSGFNDKSSTNLLKTGSAVEGACITPLIIHVDNKCMDLDRLCIFTTIPESSQAILEKTDYPGFYRIHGDYHNDKIFPNKQLFDFVQNPNGGYHVNRRSDIIPAGKIGFEEMQSDPSGPSVEVRTNEETIEKMLGNVVERSESLLYVCKYMMSVKRDEVASVKLDFWPDVTEQWFLRNREWPKPQVMENIRSSGCHLVWKEIDNLSTWRLSFSQAEIILSKEKSPFQQKIFILAKSIFTLLTNDLIDEKTGRKLPSYLIKTIMFLKLEETPLHEWKEYEEKQLQIEIVEQLFVTLSNALQIGYLSCFFVEEMNLLQKFNERFLQDTAQIFCDFFHEQDCQAFITEKFLSSPLQKMQIDTGIDFLFLFQEMLKLVKVSLRFEIESYVEKSTEYVMNGDEMIYESFVEFQKMLMNSNEVFPSFPQRVLTKIKQFFSRK